MASHSKIACPAPGLAGAEAGICDPSGISTKAYKRIVLTKSVNRQKVHSLLVDYIRSPARAMAVEELVFDVQAPPFGMARPKIFPDFERKVADQGEGTGTSELAEAVARLGLGEAESAEWLRALTSATPERFEAYEEMVLANGQEFFTTRDPSHVHFLDYAAALLVSMCPSIKTFVLGDNDYAQGPLSVFLRRNNYGLLPKQYLQHLHTVKLLHTGDMILGDGRFYAALDALTLFRLFHRLPSLDTISMDGVDQDNDGGYLSEFPPATSDLKHLHITHSAYGSSLLSAIIRVPRGLQGLTLTTGGRSTVDTGSNMMSPKTLGKALLDHKHTLCQLRVDLDAFLPDGVHVIPGGRVEESDEEDDFEDERDVYWTKDMAISTLSDKSRLNTGHLPNTRDYGRTMGSFHDFTALKQLDIGIKFLLDGVEYSRYKSKETEYSRAPFRLIDILPPGLEHLTIRGYVAGSNAYHDGQVEEFMAHKDERFPGLKEIYGIEKKVPISENVYEKERKNWKGEEEYPPLARRESVSREWIEADVQPDS
ncbi:hypothetical protein B0I35DRAFT_440509 [Stachybotrys elegans]|uniref:Uncharacterized protein n=1 Tax=Stachybotrys elegans TaxID=80388 RepID=A0A8K0WML8_9HYPO|nr:hypothetical protein B0I35DRAFT_440509 [Stachybotrys elegans]